MLREQLKKEIDQLSDEPGDRGTEFAERKEVIKILDQIDLNTGKLLTLIEKNYQLPHGFKLFEGIRLTEDTDDGK